MSFLRRRKGSDEFKTKRRDTWKGKVQLVLRNYDFKPSKEYYKQIASETTNQDLDVLATYWTESIECWSVFRSLKLLDYCLRGGTAEGIAWARSKVIFLNRCLNYTCPEDCNFKSERQIRRYAQSIFGHLDKSTARPAQLQNTVRNAPFIPPYYSRSPPPPPPPPGVIPQTSTSSPPTSPNEPQESDYFQNVNATPKQQASAPPTPDDRHPETSVPMKDHPVAGERDQTAEDVIDRCPKVTYTLDKQGRLRWTKVLQRHISIQACSMLNERHWPFENYVLILRVLDAMTFWRLVIVSIQLRYLPETEAGQSPPAQDEGIKLSPSGSIPPAPPVNVENDEDETLKSEQASPTQQRDSPPPQNGITGRMGAFFAAPDRIDPYTDDEIHQISLLLKHIEPSWSKVPRCYIILRNIDRLDVLRDLLDAGFSDYWLPVTEQHLPGCIPQGVKAAFVEAQYLIYTKALNLGRGTKGHHCYFRKGDFIPLETKALLGSGGHGQVDRVLNLVTHKEYARKRVLRSAAFKGRRKDDVQRFIAEIEILKRLDHSHIVEFVGSYTDSKYMALIMTPIAECDLGTYMSKASTADFDKLRSFYGCLATGLEYLHSHHVRHKDIKLTNIVVASGKVRFVDFGLSLDFADANNSTTISMVNGMTPRYCAPEVAAHAPRNSKSDVWSLGIVFLEMAAILKSISLNAMDDYISQRGTRQKYIRPNLGVLPELLAHFAGIGNLRDNIILTWVERMLLEEHDERPSAADLIHMIKSASSSCSGSTFCGFCCMDPSEEDFSD